LVLFLRRDSAWDGWKRERVELWNVPQEKETKRKGKVPEDDQMVRREIEPAAAGCSERGKAFIPGAWQTEDGGRRDWGCVCVCMSTEYVLCPSRRGLAKVVRRQGDGDSEGNGDEETRC
jgi:hypothetical protein